MQHLERLEHLSLAETLLRTWRQQHCWERVIQLSSANICHLMEAYTSLSMCGSRTEFSDEVGFPCNYCYSARCILPSVSCLPRTILSTKYNANWCYDFFCTFTGLSVNDMASAMLFMQAAHLNWKYLGTHSYTKAPNQYVNRLSAIWKHRRKCRQPTHPFQWSYVCSGQECQQTV